MLVYLLIVIGFCVLYPLVPRKQVKWLFLALVLALAVMAFNMVPYETDDIANYFRQINQLRRGGFGEFKRLVSENENNWGALPVCGAYFYFISFLPDNGFLPAITVFLAYGSMYLVLWLAAKRFNVGKWYLFLAAFFILSTYWFYDICSGIRNGLVFTLFSSIVYIDVVEKKARPLCWLSYVVLLGMHSSAIILFFIRIILLLSGRGKGKILSMLMVAAMVVGGALLPHLGEITGIEYFELISEKAERASEIMGVDSSTSFIVNVSVFIVCAIVVIYCLYVFSKTDVLERLNGYSKFVRFLLFFMLGSVFSALIFLRLARWVLPAMVSVIFMVGMQTAKDMEKERNMEKKHKSIIKPGTVISSNELVINFCFITYSVVHLWFACAGSSLIWLHFS